MKKFEIRTDLAVEANEEVKQSDTCLEGIAVREDYNKEMDVLVTTLTVINEKGERIIKKPIGKYITIESQKLVYADDEYHNNMSKLLARYINELLEPFLPDNRGSILVVGLGNRMVTPDSLGPDVIDGLYIDRHVADEEEIALSGVVPGVMAQTGMETAEIIKGIVEQTAPDVVIAIDALAARNSNRLNTTIQLSDRGIHPGSGVGNHRVGIVKESIGVPVLAIGVPTVIDAPTIVSDTMDNFVNALATSKELQSISKTLSEYNSKEKYNLICEIINPQMVDMYVTPKDVDATIKLIAATVSEAINIVAGKK